MMWVDSEEPQTYDRTLLRGGLSEISSVLPVDTCRLRSKEADRSIESEGESVSSTKMEIGTERLR